MTTAHLPSADTSKTKEPTPLEEAINKGDASAVKTLIEQKADPNGFGTYGDSPLTRAVLCWSTISTEHNQKGQQVVETLLEGKADINAPANSESKETVLHRLIRHDRDRNKIKFFLEHKATPEIANKDGQNAFYAATRFHPHTGLDKFMLAVCDSISTAEGNGGSKPDSENASTPAPAKLTVG